MNLQKEDQGKEVTQEEVNLQYYEFKKNKNSKRFKDLFLRKETRVLQEDLDQKKKETHLQQELLENLLK